MNDCEAAFMTPDEISSLLGSMAQSDNFEWESETLIDQWESSNVGFEAVEPTLRFMEEHSSIEFGTPGPLVHFVENFYGNGYEEKLLESFSRKPTMHTAWMLNRLINGAKVFAEKRRLVMAMAQARENPLADPDTLSAINGFLERQGVR
jgi:hypothetical protein